MERNEGNLIDFIFLNILFIIVSWVFLYRWGMLCILTLHVEERSTIPKERKEKKIKLDAKFLVMNVDNM